MKYKKGDIVLAKSLAVPAMKPFQLKLKKKVVVNERKGRTMDWPGYTGWHAELVRKSDADRMRKRWRIPYSFPDDLETFVFEEEIIKRIRRGRV